MRWQPPFLVAATVTLLVAHAPASLIDHGLAGATADGLRLMRAEGSLWKGRGVIATLAGDGRTARPWMPIEWQLAQFPLISGSLTWQFASGGSSIGELRLTPAGIGVSALKVHAPTAAVLDLIPNALARAGWHGDLAVTVTHWGCTYRRECNGDAHLLWQGAGSALFPGRHFGDYEVHASASHGALNYDVRTRGGEIVVTGRGQQLAGKAPQFEGTVRGDAGLLAQLPAMSGGTVHSTPAADTFMLRWPPR